MVVAAAWRVGPRQQRGFQEARQLAWRQRRRKVNEAGVAVEHERFVPICLLRLLLRS